MSGLGKKAKAGNRSQNRESSSVYARPAVEAQIRPSPPPSPVALERATIAKSIAPSIGAKEKAWRLLLLLLLLRGFWVHRFQNARARA
jgi:hypothetical protein